VNPGHQRGAPARASVSRNFEPRLQVHGSQTMETETAAFGYLARALCFEQRVRLDGLWLSATGAVI
jgi:hypothetical protein